MSDAAPPMTTADGRAALAALYRDTLLGDVMPFWLRHGMDREHGGIITSLDRDGTVVDTDKSVWFQGRAGWMFATLYNTVERRAEWLEAARSCVEFSRRHCFSPDGKMWFSVTREGQPLRMRRYVYSESFAAIAFAAYAKAGGDARAAEDAVKTFATYLRYSFEPGVMTPKFEPTRPMKSIGPHMIGIATAQELRANLGDVSVAGRTCTEWIDRSIAEIERDFMKPEHQALMEVVTPDGGVIDHFDGRTLNPGHAIEAAWFIMHEGKLRGDQRLIRIGRTILDWMWARGWDEECGGIYYFRDLRGLPVQEYWHDMKFWWPHNEAIIATLLAWTLAGDAKYARWHQMAHDWSFAHFADTEHGEWYGYLHRDGSVSSRLKGGMWKGPFHLPRMLWYCWQTLAASQ
ncbi:MAG: AGE family epimerase/isomerase [Verrucomicrobia bacterium]|nr:AGE family epimerase/isomerase [Verrucomicrobiota bacterium]